LLVLSACARPGAVVVEPAGAPAAGQLRVVSYNVNFGLAGDLEEILRVLPYWPRDRYLELAPKYWRATRGRLKREELATPISAFEVPPQAMHQMAATSASASADPSP
jgi:hypothetical protein